MKISYGKLFYILGMLLNLFLIFLCFDKLYDLYFREYTPVTLTLVDYEKGRNSEYFLYEYFVDNQRYTFDVKFSGDLATYSFNHNRKKIQKTMIDYPYALSSGMVRTIGNSTEGEYDINNPSRARIPGSVTLGQFLTILAVTIAFIATISFFKYLFSYSPEDENSDLNSSHESKISPIGIFVTVLGICFLLFVISSIIDEPDGFSNLDASTIGGLIICSSFVVIGIGISVSHASSVTESHNISRVYRVAKVEKEPDEYEVLFIYCGKYDSNKVYDINDKMPAIATTMEYDTQSDKFVVGQYYMLNVPPHLTKEDSDFILIS